MALWKPFRGSRADLDAVEKHDGYVYFCDDGALFFDYTDADGNLQRKQINEAYIKNLLNMTNDIGYIDAGNITNEEVNVNG